MSNFLTAIAAISAIGQQAPPVPVIDPAIELLKASKLQYTDIGDFCSVKYTIGEKRSQVTYLRKLLNEYRSLKNCEVFGIVYESPTQVPTSLLISTFQKQYILGGLIYELPSETQKLYRIRFRVSLPINSLPEMTKEYLNTVAVASDALEAELNPTGEDKF